MHRGKWSSIRDYGVWTDGYGKDLHDYCHRRYRLVKGVTHETDYVVPQKPSLRICSKIPTVLGSPSVPLRCGVRLVPTFCRLHHLLPSRSPLLVVLENRTIPGSRYMRHRHWNLFNPSLLHPKSSGQPEAPPRTIPAPGRFFFLPSNKNLIHV